MNYKEKADILYKSNFRFYGIGNFDVNSDELAEILELLDLNPYGLKDYYLELYDKRMG